MIPFTYPLDRHLSHTCIQLGKMLRLPYLSHRHYSCSYSERKPLFSPFWASLLLGSVFSSSIVATITASRIQTRQQLERIELEIKGLKEKNGGSRT